MREAVEKLERSTIHHGITIPADLEIVEVLEGYTNPWDNRETEELRLPELLVNANKMLEMARG